MTRLRRYLYWATVAVLFTVSTVIAVLFFFGGLLFSAFGPPR